MKIKFGKASMWKSLVRWASLLALIGAGCSGTPTKILKVTCQRVTGGGGTSCTATTQQSQDGVAPQDVSSAASSSSVSAYRLILNLPSDVVINTQSPVQATLSATTDTGYTSSITVDLQSTTSTTQPIAAGDTVYTFLLPNTAQVTDWAATVTTNSNSSININSSIISGLNLLGNPGSYSVTVQQVTEGTGLTTVGSLGVTDPGPVGSGGTCPPNKPCPVGPPQS